MSFELLFVFIGTSKILLCIIRTTKISVFKFCIKVNDIISSIKSDLIFANEVYYSLKAIDGELKFLEST